MVARRSVRGTILRTSRVGAAQTRDFTASARFFRDEPACGTMFRHRAALLSVLFFARRSHYNSPFERRAVGAHYFVPFPTMHRSYRFFRFGIVLQLAGLAALAACSSPPQQPKFQQEMFDTGASPFSRHFAATSSDACEAARRALLSQGYLTTTTRSDTIDASKDFQPSGDKHITVEFHVVCTAGDDAENSSLVYANAVQSGFALKKSDTSASVGLSIFGSLSLPIRSNSDAMVKVSSETIQSQKFYERFFDYVDQYLRTVVKAVPVPQPSKIKSSELPGSPPAAAATPSTPADAGKDNLASQPAAAAPAGPPTQ